LRKVNTDDMIEHNDENIKKAFGESLRNKYNETNAYNEELEPQALVEC
jgi:hypothetical protein